MIRRKKTSVNVHSCVKYFVKVFPDTDQFSPQRLFEKGDKRVHDLYCTIRRKMEGGLVIENWVKLWNPLLVKTDFTVQETQHLTLGIRLAKTPPEVHRGWKGNQLMATTITELWVGA